MTKSKGKTISRDLKGKHLGCAEIVPVDELSHDHLTRGLVCGYRLVRNRTGRRRQAWLR